jgi:hypothetical protein
MDLVVTIKVEQFQFGTTEEDPEAAVRKFFAEDPYLQEDFWNKNWRPDKLEISNVSDVTLDLEGGS